MEAQGQGVSPVLVTTDTWYELADIASNRAGRSLTTWEGCCLYYNLCAVSVVTAFSMALWNLWKRLNGASNCSYEEYWHLPAIYVHACETIESEIAMVQASANTGTVVKDVLNRRK